MDQTVTSQTKCGLLYMLEQAVLGVPNRICSSPLHSLIPFGREYLLHLVRQAGSEMTTPISETAACVNLLPVFF